MLDGRPRDRRDPRPLRMGGGRIRIGSGLGPLASIPGAAAPVAIDE